MESEECVVRLDRLQLYTEIDPAPILKLHPDFKSEKAHTLKPPKAGEFRAYDRVHWFYSRTSKMKFVIESKLRKPFMPQPYRITLYADDRTGLLMEEVFSILEVLPSFHLTLVELAFDFRRDLVNRRFVKRHALFGKTEPTPSVNSTDYWGSRKQSKRVQSYKKEIEGAA